MTHEEQTVLVYHVVSLLYIAGGSIVVLIGFYLTSAANGGWAARANTNVKRVVDFILRRRPEHHSGAAIAAPMAVISARGWVIDGPLDSKLSDSEKIDALWKMLHRHEVDTAKSIDTLYGLGDNEVRARQKLAVDTHEEFQGLRVEMIYNLRKSALEGLRIAAIGAGLIATGDIIAAVIAVIYG